MAPPILVNTPESMLKIRIVAPKDYSGDTLKSLHALGVLDVEQDQIKVDYTSEIETNLKRINTSLTRIEHLLVLLPQKETVTITGDLKLAYKHNLNESLDDVEIFYSKIDRKHEASLNLENQLRTLNDLKKYLSQLSLQLNVKIRDLNYSGHFLFSRLIVIPRSVNDAFINQTNKLVLEHITAMVDEDIAMYFLARIENKNKILSILEQSGGRVIPVPDEDISLADYFDQLDSKISVIEGEYSGVVVDLQNSVRENLQQLLLLRYVLQAEKERFAVLQKAFESKYITMFEGWIPEASLGSVTAKLEETNKYALVDSREPAKNENPPIKQKNTMALKPFEVIVNLFAVPKYGDWDPTPIVAYSFAVFFGIMFNDAIYGIALILGAKFVLHRLVDNPQSDGFILFRRVLMICGGVAAVLGMLSGSYMGNIYVLFGIENPPVIIPALGVWLGDPLKFLILAILIGLVHTNLAHIIGLYRAIKKRDTGTLYNKAGLFIVEIFGIPIIVKIFLGVELIKLSNQMSTIFLILMFVGIILIIYSQLKAFKALGAILWIFDITGLLGDVMSYARLTGVSLAGFYMASSFNQIADLARHLIPGVIGAILGIIFMIVILLFAHILNLFLGVLSCFVHSLRLCFVEFLMKFYEGGGVEYKPLKLKMPKTIVVGGKT